MFAGILGGSSRPQEIVVDAANFDGDGSDTGSPTLKRGAGLTGVQDGKRGTVSFWIDPYTFTIARRIIVGTTVLNNWASSNVRFRVTSSVSVPHIAIEGFNAAGTEILRLACSISTGAGSQPWQHIAASWDLERGRGHLLVDGVDRLSGSILTNDTIDYTLADWGIMKATDGGSNGDAALAEVYLNTFDYLDLSILSNVLRLRSMNNKPVTLGGNGSLVTGRIPPIYLHLDNAEAVANFHANDGNGGAFTQSGGGTYATHSTSPSD